MTGESSAKPLPRKGALRKKKRKVTYLEDSVGSTGDEYDLKAVNIKVPSNRKFTKSIAAIPNSTNLKRISASQQPPNQKLITQFFRSVKTSSPTVGKDRMKSAAVQKVKNSGATTSGKVMDRTKKPHVTNIDSPEAIFNDAADNTVSVASRRGTYPRYKVVEGTSFAVDEFRFGYIEDVTHYFLTHYHADHYIGLKRTFNKPLYASTITAKLVRHFIGVDALYIKEMNINTEYSVENIKVIALDVNHCPGAVMFLFKFPCGRCTLHTGHFRASVEMESYPQFWSCNIDTVYLDTTYIKEHANFKLQMNSIEEVKNHVQRFLNKNINNKFLIVVGTYIIGKEKLWLSIANTFKIKVWLEETRRKAVNLIYGDRSPSLRWVVANKDEASMHVIPINKINYQMLVEYHKSYRDRMLLGVRPSGCGKSNASKATFNSPVSLIRVQYSEHSSYDELDRFIRFLRPEKIISTVSTSQSACEMPIIPKKFYYSGKLNEPRQFDFQISLPNLNRSMSIKSDPDETLSLADYMS